VLSHITSYGIELGPLSHLAKKIDNSFTMGSSTSPWTTTNVATTTIPSIPINEKLTKMNHPLWCAYVLPAICTPQYEGLLTGTDIVSSKQVVVTNVDKSTTSTDNPTYFVWVALDQAVLGYLPSSLTRETLMHVSRCTTAAEARGTLATLYSSQMCARWINTRIVLITTKKNHLSIYDYYG
jgi:hypothetical protein